MPKNINVVRGPTLPKKALSVKIDPVFLKEINRFMKSKKINFSDLARTAISEYINKQKQA